MSIPNIFSNGLIASKFNPEDLSWLCLRGDFLSYQAAVVGLIGIPVKVTPIVARMYLLLFVFFGLMGKQNFKCRLINVLGFPFVGNSPISWFGTPFDIIHLNNLV